MLRYFCVLDDIFATRFNIRHNGKEHRYFLARRLKYYPGDTYNSSDMSHFRAWPQDFDNISPQEVHDDYICPDVTGL